MYKPATGTPFSNRLLITGPMLFEDPYRTYPGGSPHPMAQPPGPDADYPAFAQFLPIDPDINSTRAQTWNVTVERQFLANWQASVSYLGSYTDRLWGGVQMNPAVYMGLGPCTIHGVSYNPCTQDANLNQRRMLFLENPQAGQGLSYVTRLADVGEQAYRGLMLSVRRRAASGVSFNGNYTISHCEADTYISGGWQQFEEGYQKPDDPSFDRGNCVQNRRQVANVSVSAATPQFTSTALRVLASDWRVAGIVSARSGSWLTVTTNQDIAARASLDNASINCATTRMATGLWPPIWIGRRLRSRTAARLAITATTALKARDTGLLTSPSHGSSTLPRARAWSFASRYSTS
jgi:hypothetical protein